MSMKNTYDTIGNRTREGDWQLGLFMEVEYVRKVAVHL
jgi:hypothetical protein